MSGRREKAREYCDAALGIWEKVPRSKRAYQVATALKKALDEE